MPAGGLLALLDDVATLTKVATQRVTGVIGDDLALNAKAMIDLEQDREIPLVMKVAKGSLLNKAILVPSALAVSVIAPWIITPLMIAGGAFLCYEGVEKIVHAKKPQSQTVDSLAPVKGSDLEKQKVAAAVRTDFVLSAEIIILSLGVMAAAPLVTKAIALAAVGLGMTVGVYGMVAGLLRLDNVGLKMMSSESSFKKTFGKALVHSVPYIMKGLSLFGTVAMFSVGGGILVHSLPVIGHAVGSLGFLASTAITAVAGVAAGFAAIPAVKALAKPVEKLKNFVLGIVGKKPRPESASGPATNATHDIDPANDALARAKDLLKNSVNRNAPPPAPTGPKDITPPKAAPTRKP